MANTHLFSSRTMVVALASFFVALCLLLFTPISGKVALVNTTTALSVACPTTGIVDLLGYGTANCYEGTAAPALTKTTSAIGASVGCTDTGNNASDFSAATCDSSNSPRNSATATHTCTCR